MIKNCLKTFKIKTLGCKVNQYDSQQIREALLRRGFSEDGFGKKPQLYVINTCTVTGRTDNKSFGLIRKAIRENPASKILVTGCFAKAEPRLIKQAFGKDVILDAPYLRSLEFADIKNTGIKDFTGHSRAFIKIQDGCDNRCSYCKISLVRGGSKSRDFKKIIQEAERLIKKGFKELILCGICLGSYGKEFKPRLTLSDVIRALIDIKEDFRLRLSSIEAKDITDELIQIASTSSKLCPHFHIPFQSGDDSLLKRMNRKYSSQDYLDTVTRIRKSIPEVAITTDIMVGFPGETEANFKNTLEFLKRVFPARVHCFPFSPRPGTSAFKMANKIPHKTVGERMSLLLGKAKQMSRAYQSKFFGKELEILIEAKPDKKTGFNRGYSENYIYTLVQVKGLVAGQIVKVKATALNSHYLVAEIATKSH